MNIPTTLVDIETREDCIQTSSSKLEDGMIAIELGSYLGGSVILLAQVLKGKQVEIYAIDNWKCENISPESLALGNLQNHNQVWSAFNENLKKYNVEGEIFPIVSNTVDAAKLFKDKSINYIFFDASHDYQDLVNELRAWLPKMADKCFAFVHDFPSESVKKAVYDVIGEENCVTVRGGSSVIIRNTL